MYRKGTARRQWLARLSLEEAIGSLDCMAELPSVDDFICILQKCRKTKDLAYAKRVHAHICSNGLETHTAVGNYIVPMFVECGSLPAAEQVFGQLVHRNEHSWTSLIMGYVQFGQLNHALNLYQKMQEDNVHPSSFTLVPLLKACAVLKYVAKGREIHVQIAQKGLEREPAVSSSLVSMYAKCGLLSEAWEVFDKLSVREVVTWTALIAGYAEHGPAQEALKCFEQMQLELISPNTVTFICVLKVCGSTGEMDKGQEIHAKIRQNGFERGLFLGSTLVSMYAKCGLLLEAQTVFDELAIRDVVSWNALISGYVEGGLGQEGLNCFERMHLEGISPDTGTFVGALKACSSICAMDLGQKLHEEIIHEGLERDVFVGTGVVGVYAQCGSILEAQEVLAKLVVRDVVSWNAMASGCAEHGPVEEAINSLEQMCLEGVSPDAVTFVSGLKACGVIKAIEKGREIHRAIFQKGLERYHLIGNALVDMYAKCGCLLESFDVFEELPVQDVISWNALIGGYAEHGLGQDALQCFEQMQLEGVLPNIVTFVCTLKACGSIGAIEKGRDIHSKITQEGLGRDIFIGNTLVDMYAKCGSLSEAQEVFMKLPVREVVSWTALIAGFTEHGPGPEALKLFEQMQVEGISPNPVTLVYVLKSCSNTGAIDKGRDIHMHMIQKGSEMNVFVGSTLVGMYAQCGSLLEAWQMFEDLPVQDVVSWNVLIAEYADHGLGEVALQHFEQMQLENVIPDAVTFVSVLKVCGSIGAIGRGQEIHTKLTERGFERCPIVGNALVDMYANCGSISEAREVFEKLPERDVVTWNILTAGYAMNREDNMVLQCFEAMQEQGVKPNAVTFTSLFNACSHASLVIQGEEFFKVMREEYGIAPTLDHYTCMVSLLARSGHLYDALKFLETVPCPLSEGMWRALLSSCKVYGEADLGFRCFQQLVQMNQVDASSYVLMANIYANAGRWDDAFKIEELRKEAGARKKPARALIEVNKKVHEFVVGSVQIEEISAVLSTLSSCMEQEGHVPNLDLISRPIPDEKSEESSTL